MTTEELERYKRHILLPEIGIAGQEKLKVARILVIGAGGLGSPVLLYLAAAGIGTIGIIDGDTVDRSNLQRQIIHTTDDIDRLKVTSAKEKIEALNPNTNVIVHDCFIEERNAEELIAQYDFVVDATDSFDAKFLINDTCVKLNIPYNHGAIFRYQGQTMTITPGSACYRCLFESKPTSGEIAGPLGVVPGILGAIQAAEAIKYITKTGTLLTNRLLTFDSRSMQFTTFDISLNSSCPNHIKKLKNIK